MPAKIRVGGDAMVLKLLMLYRAMGLLLFYFSSKF
jgi:hypothetical protein